MNRTRSIMWTIAVLIAIAVTTVFLLRPTDQRVEAAPNLPTAPSAALALTPERAAELGAQVRSADPPALGPSGSRTGPSAPRAPLGAGARGRATGATPAFTKLEEALFPGL